MSENQNNPAKRFLGQQPLWSAVLLGAAMLGLGAAFVEAVFFKPLPPASVASVNGKGIAENEFQHVLSVVGQGRTKALSERERGELLSRMIDNELLLQKANQLGLAQTHPAMRRALIEAMIEFVLDRAEKTPPRDEVLRSFYKKHKSWFQISERLQVQRLYFTLENKTQVARAIAQIKKGVPFSKIKSDEVAQPPNYPVPLETLAQYLGGDMVAIAQKMKEGSVSAPIETLRGIFLLRLNKRLPAQSPAFDKVKEQVARQYMRYQDEQALQDYIKELRATARIQIK